MLTFSMKSLFRWAKRAGVNRSLMFSLMIGSLLITGIAKADVNTFSLKQPLSNATVREKVPIRVSRSVLNNAGYATITIDDVFKAAPAIPESGDTIYVWNTKASSESSSDPNAQSATSDGMHTIKVSLFDHDSNEIGEAVSTVKVANNILSLPDGVKLVYKWRPNMQLTYNRTSEVDQVDSGGNKIPLIITNAPIMRGVEDFSDGNALLRDTVDTSGVAQLGSGGGSEPITSIFHLNSKYWTVDKYGKLITNNQALGDSDHFGLSITEFPERRVNVGDTWETHILATLQWAYDLPAVLRGTAKLASFEWQDGYPTAKIEETFDGNQKTIPISKNPNMPAVQVDHLVINRTVWFAYQAGMVIRATTTMNATTQLSSEQFAIIKGNGAADTSSATDAGDNNAAIAQQGGTGSGVPSWMSMLPKGMKIPGISSVNPTPTQQDQHNAISIEMTETQTLSHVGTM